MSLILIVVRLLHQVSSTSRCDLCQFYHLEILQLTTVWCSAKGQLTVSLTRPPNSFCTITANSLEASKIQSWENVQPILLKSSHCWYDLAAAAVKVALPDQNSVFYTMVGVWVEMNLVLHFCATKQQSDPNSPVSRLRRPQRGPHRGSWGGFPPVTHPRDSQGCISHDSPETPTHTMTLCKRVCKVPMPFIYSQVWKHCVTNKH